MKKMFILIAVSLFSLSLFAVGGRPVVSISNAKNYKIVVNGRSYFSNNSTLIIQGLNNGQHNIKVYEMQNNFRGRVEKLVNNVSFFLRQKDVLIDINLNGGLTIREARFNANNRSRIRESKVVYHQPIVTRARF